VLRLELPTQEVVEVVDMVIQAVQAVLALSSSKSLTPRLLHLLMA
jgi:hypothetical protein